jgi:hypothetical protein
VEYAEQGIVPHSGSLSVISLTFTTRKDLYLLEALKEHLPDRIGGAKGLDFEEAHSISCQGPEPTQIEPIRL